MEVVFFSDEYNKKIHDILRTDLAKVLKLSALTTTLTPPNLSDFPRTFHHAANKPIHQSLKGL